MATEFDDSTHFATFKGAGAIRTGNAFDVRWSEITLAALRSAGFLDNMVDGTVPPSIDNLWLDKNFDPAVLKEWNPVGFNWEPVTSQTLFGRVPWRGPWQSSIIYRRADVVSYQGAIWIALQPSQNTAPVDGPYWNLFLPSLADEAVTTQKIAAKAVTPSKLADGIMRFDTVAALQAGTIPSTVTNVRTAGYSALSDGGGGTYIKLSAAPSPVRAWHKQSADGAWWELSEKVTSPQMFGGVAGGVLNNDLALMQADLYGKPIYLDGVFAASAMVVGDFLGPGSIKVGDRFYRGPALGGRLEGEYLGQVATRAGACQSVNTTNKQMNSRSRHFAREKISSLQMIFPNWYLSASAEQASGGSITLTASVEYPIGSFTQVKWGGATSIVVADSSNAAPSDSVQVEIPQGAEFFVRTWLTSANGIIFSPQKDYQNGERCGFGPTGLTDKTMTGGVDTLEDNGQQTIYRPIAIIGKMSNKSVFLIGDSREFGIGDAANESSDIGYAERSLSRQCALINVSRSGYSASEYVASHALSLPLAQYCSDVLIHIGINDALAGDSAATIIANLKTIAGYFPDKPVWLATVEPVSSSTDGWTTVANQTPDASDAVRRSLNSAIRAGLADEAGYFEIADVLESARDSGRWRVLGSMPLTGDGTHANSTGYRYVQEMNAIDASAIYARRTRQARFATPEEAASGRAAGIPLDPLSLTKRPRFKAVKGGATLYSQTVPSDTQTILTFGFTSTNIGGYFNVSNGRFTPPKGTYRLKAQASVNAGIVDGALVTLSLLKNGVLYSQFFMRTSGSSFFSTAHDDIADASGSDYFEVAFQMSGAGDKTITGNNLQTFFEGYAI